jgi:ABC-type glycerol-3-phosphate transport system substrate-binding protein
MQRLIVSAAFVACLLAPFTILAAEPLELQWWHAMTAINADRVNKIATDSSASQTAYKIVPVFKGSYTETMKAGIAAYRAGTAPHIIHESANMKSCDDRSGFLHSREPLKSKRSVQTWRKHHRDSR